MTCIAFLAAFGAAVSGCPETAPTSPAAADPAAYYRKLDSTGASVDPLAARDMISVWRKNNGLPTLAVDPALQREAEAQARAMAKTGAANPALRGGLKTRLAAARIESRVAVENVSAGYHTLAEAFSGWRQSPLHNANMLAPGARRMGIATAFSAGSKYHVFWSLVLTD